MPRWITALLIVISLTGWGLSIRQWNADGLWYDEVWSNINAGGPPDGPLSPAGIAYHLATEDPDQGIAYPLILAAWSAFVGWTPFAGRALSALIGLLCAGLVARLGRRLYHAQAGAAAATIMLLSPFFIYYTHELRVFTLVALSVAGLVWTYLDIMAYRGHSRMRLLLSSGGFILAGLGLLYTHYFAATILVAVGLMHGVSLIIYLLSSDRAGQISLKKGTSPFLRRWVRVTLLFIMVGLLFVPWLPVFAQSLQRTSTRADVHEKSLSSLELIEAVSYYLGSGLAILTVILIVIGLWAAWRRGEWTRWTAVTALAAWAVVIGFNAVLQIIEPGRVRYLIVLWPLLALVMGMGVIFISQRIGSLTKEMRLAPVLSSITIVLLALNSVRANFDPAYEARMEQGWTPPWQQMTRIIQERGGPNDLFLFYAGPQHARHFYPFTSVTRGLPLASPALLTESLVDPTYGAGIQAQIDDAARLWYGIDKTQPERPVLSVMQEALEAFTLCDTLIDTERLSFALYARHAALCEASPRVVYSDQLAFVASWPKEWHERTLQIDILWRVGEGVEGVVSVSIQVLDESGQPVAQQDAGLPRGPYGFTREILELGDVPAGDYRVVAIVYRWQTGERLTGQALDGATTDILEIGVAHIGE